MTTKLILNEMPSITLITSSSKKINVKHFH